MQAVCCMQCEWLPAYRQQCEWLPAYRQPEKPITCFLQDPLPALLRARCAAAALLRWHGAPSLADLNQQHAVDSEGGASHTQHSNLCSGLHWLRMPWKQHCSRHYGTASKAPRVLPADAQPNLYSRSALIQAVAKIAQQVGPESFSPVDTPLVGATRPTAGSPDVYACNLLIGPRSNKHHYWLQPLTYVEAGVAYDLGRSTVLGLEYTVNFHPDAYSSRDRELMRLDLQQWRPSVFAVAMQSSAAQPPLTYDCLKARILADRAVTSEAERLARSAERSYVDAAVADIDFHGCTNLANGTYRAALHEWVKHSDISTRAANSGRSSRKRIFHYRTYEAKLAAAVAADAMR